MTREECIEKMQTDKEFTSVFNKAKYRSRKSWQGMIRHMKQERPGVDVQLHHVNTHDPNYENWWPVVPL